MFVVKWDLLGERVSTFQWGRGAEEMCITVGGGGEECLWVMGHTHNDATKGPKKKKKKTGRTIMLY